MNSEENPFKTVRNSASAAVAAAFALATVSAIETVAGRGAPQGGVTASPSPAPVPEFRALPEVSLGAGLIAGLNNPNNYIKLPTTAAVHFPVAPINLPLLGRASVSGTSGVLIETILRGVETRHIAAQIGPRFRFGREGASLRPFLDLRGGVGVTDSGSYPAGQGQDLCFNAWILAGLECVPPSLKGRAALWAGILYTHVSNAGLSEPERPNTGLDSIGVATGGIWKF